MQASETKLQQIIEGTKQYLVPLFQRAYSWKKSEWKILWDDLEELCTQDNPRPHFMGSIVTMPTTSVPEGITKYLLIDGQQRLTTVFILLAALRDIAKLSHEEELAEEINNTILINPYKKGLEKYKLQPTQLDRIEFHKIIDNQTQPSGCGILECYRFFEQKIRRSSLELSQIKKVICNSFSLVSVVLGIDGLQKDVTNKIDGLKQEVTDLKVAIAKLSNLATDVQELKSTQNNQTWALISLLGITVMGTLIKEFISIPKI